MVTLIYSGYYAALFRWRQTNHAQVDRLPLRRVGSANRKNYDSRLLDLDLAGGTAQELIPIVSQRRLGKQFFSGDFELHGGTGMYGGGDEADFVGAGFF